MKFGHYSDNSIPKMTRYQDYKSNSHGYRCPEFRSTDGGKDVVILGCSHTYAEGLEEHEGWVGQLASKKYQTTLRWWNLAYPGASGDFMVRVLYGTEKVLYPKIIICCWPALSRRERLDEHPRFLYRNSPELKIENKWTDENNFLKNVFLTEKFAERCEGMVFHCFAEEVYDLKNKKCYTKTTLKSCWPEWDSHHLRNAKRERITQFNLARDGMHYGTEHHRVFAEQLYNAFGSKLK
jgi:hypothetical protein